MKNKVISLAILTFSILTFSFSLKALTVMFENRTKTPVVFNPYVLRGLEGTQPAMSGRKLFSDVAEIRKEGKLIIVKHASRINIDNAQEKSKLIVQPKEQIKYIFDDAGDFALCIDPTNLWIQKFTGKEFSTPKRAPLSVIKGENDEQRRKISEALQHLADKSKELSETTENYSDETVKDVSQATKDILSLAPDFAKIFEDKYCDAMQDYYLYAIAKAEKGNMLVSNYRFISFK